MREKFPKQSVGSEVDAHQKLSTGNNTQSSPFAIDALFDKELRP
jgi:hypothetical protein